MNEAEGIDGTTPVGFLDSPHGRLRLTAAGVLRAVVRDARGGTRAAAAGDGFAADIVDAVESGDVSSLSVDAGTLHAVRAANRAKSTAENSAGTNGVRRPNEDQGTRETAFAVDMTNWSVVVAGATTASTTSTGRVPRVVKFVGEWGSADRAAIQLERLTAGAHETVPTFLGRLDWVHPTRGRATIALVSELMLGAADGWTWAVDDLLAYSSGGQRPPWPAALGALIADMHACLSECVDVAAPQPHGTYLRARAEAALDEALRITNGDAGVLLAHRVDALRNAIGSIPDVPTSTVFDIHGDLHVGQILRAGTADDAYDGAANDAPYRYRVIDFDGDPQLDSRERAQPDHAARDIAHVLTSVDMVAAIVMKRLGAASESVLGWAASAKRELLASYTAALAESRTFASGTGESGTAEILDERLLDGFIAEQYLRELIYAHRFLPRWQYAPDAGITFGYPSHTENNEDPPWTPPAFTTT
jgi:maltokinase